MTESGTPVVPEGVSELDVVGVRRGSFQVSGSGDTSGFGGLVSPIVMPAPTERPYGGWFDELADEIELALADRNLPVSSVIDKVVVIVFKTIRFRFVLMQADATICSMRRRPRVRVVASETQTNLTARSLNSVEALAQPDIKKKK